MPSLPSLPTQLVDLGMPFAAGEQGRFLGHDIAAVTLTTQQTNGSVGDVVSAVGVRRLGQLGRATEALLSSLDSSLGGAFRTPDSLFFADRAASGWTVRLTLVLALSYGSREEIVAAARSLAADAAAGKLDPARIDNALFASRLDTAAFPDPDLLIRTSGELRVSNFLLWQISYAEIVIVKKFWPEFRQGDLFEAVDEYRRRHRRFGAL